MARDYFRLLTEHGLLRDDMDADELGYAYQATFEGFLRADDGVPAEGLERRADLLARTVQRAFENGPAPGDGTLPGLADSVVALLSDLIDDGRDESGVPRPDPDRPAPPRTRRRR
nr:hypothetical protein GCM10020093_037630 [Planobispora longispora]